MIRRPRHLLPVTTALLLLGAHAAAATHWLLVQHEACAAHGEWVHDDASHHDHGRAAAPADAPTLTASAADHAHDHCLVALLGRDRAAVPAVDLATLALHGHASDVAAAVPPLCVRATESVLEYAPKSSPPA